MPARAVSCIPAADIELGLSSSRKGCTLAGSSERNASRSRKLYSADTGVDEGESNVVVDGLADSPEDDQLRKGEGCVRTTCTILTCCKCWNAHLCSRTRPNGEIRGSTSTKYEFGAGLPLHSRHNRSSGSHVPRSREGNTRAFLCRRRQNRYPQEGSSRMLLDPTTDQDEAREFG